MLCGAFHVASSIRYGTIFAMNDQEVSYPEPAAPAPAKKEGFSELLRFIVIAVLIVLPIRTLVAQPFIVSGSSMFPTFKDNQYLIVDQISYRFEEPARGDVVIFRYPLDPSKFFIKRVIGLPGEKVVIKGGKVSIFDADDKKIELDEPYLENVSSDSGTFSLGTEEYFVMGDNRTASSDSRAWGVLPRKNIVGRALVRLLPVSDISLNPGEYHFAE